MVSLPDKKIIDEIILKVDQLPQIQCPVSHYFAPGVYVREMFIPAGTIAVGHIHKTAHICSVIMGEIAFLKMDRSVDFMQAPNTFLAAAGRKIVYTIKDTIVQNIHPNPDDLTDQDELEELLIEKGEVNDLLENQGQPERSEDKEDYLELSAGFRTALTIRKSNIHGKGLFASWPFNKDDYICPYMVEGKFTEAAKYINHAKHPNAFVMNMAPLEMAVFAKKNIRGCVGGNPGDEITLDYKELKI